jgi:hypothetical protein
MDMIREAVANMPNALREKWTDNTAKLPAARRAQIKRLLAEARQAESQN